MNVALFASAFHPHVGGVEEHVRQIARELIRRDMRPIVVTNLWPLDLPSHQKFEGIDVYRIPMRIAEGPLKARIKYHLTRGGILSALRAILSRHQIDVFHVQCVSSNGYWAQLAHRHLGGRLIVSTHGERTMDATGLYARSAFTRKLFSSLLTQADHVTACSAHTLKDAEANIGKALGSRGSVVHNGIRLEDFENVEPFANRTPYVLAIGRLVPQKGFDVLLQAACRADLKDHQILIAGDGPQRQSLEELSMSLGLQHSVQFLGVADRTRAVALFKGCSLFVLPSRQEPMGIVNLEAMAAGKAIVASRVGGVPEIVSDGENGVLVTPEDPTALASALTRVIADRPLRDRLGIAGTSRVQAFSWSAVADRYLDLYQPSSAGRATSKGNSITALVPA